MIKNNKIALIADLHFGVMKNSDIFLNTQIDFFINQFFPYLIENQIDHIIVLGDIFHDRTSINVKILNRIYDLFKSDGKQFNWYLLTGNHDCYYKSSIKVNSLKMFEDLKNVVVIQDIEMINIKNKDILLVPWQTDHTEFKQRVLNKNIDCDICMGHFDINGFKMNNNFINPNGITEELFLNNYGITFSGHFHTRSKAHRNGKTIQYIGSINELTRSDRDDCKGFCVLDLKTLEYEFIDNMVSLKYIELTYPETFSRELICGNLIDVNVIIDQNYDEEEVQKYIELIQDYQPIILSPVKYENRGITRNKQEFKSQTFDEIIKEYIYSLNIDDDHDYVYNRVIELYEECRNENV